MCALPRSVRVSRPEGHACTCRWVVQRRRPFLVAAALLAIVAVRSVLHITEPALALAADAAEQHSMAMVGLGCRWAPGLRIPGLGARVRGARLRGLAQGDAEVTAGEEDDELETWRAAYNLEVERAELIEEQLKTELGRLGDFNAKLLEEFEGCMVDLESIPERPESSASDEWAQAYLAIRRCNEQSELRLGEARAKLQERGTAREVSQAATVTQDFGPIQYKKIKYKDISFPRFSTENGSSIYFLELPLPLGLKLEEATLQPPGLYQVRAVQIIEVVDGGSAVKDGRIRAGDYIRCITVPRPKLNEEGEVDDAVGFGTGTGEFTKALLTIPTSSSFPLERILSDMQKNSQMDGYVGLVLERPLR